MANSVMVRVFDGEGAPKRGQPALFWSKGFTLFEEATAFLNARYCQRGSRASPQTWRNVAEAVAFWINWCVAANVDWKFAHVGNLSDYAEGLATTISPHTKQAYSSGTIAARLEAVIEFYDFARRKCGYFGDIASSKAVAQGLGDYAADVEPANYLVPTRRGSRNCVRPFRQSDLRLFLSTLGPTPIEQLHGDHRSSRGRLMADWGWAVGLRVSEIVSLEVPQLLVLLPEPEAPFAYRPVEVVGKGRKRRNVVVPNWLVEETLTYVQHERARTLTHRDKPSRRFEQKLFLSEVTSRKPGRGVGVRRFQQVVELTCIKAGLTRIKTRTDPMTKVITRSPVASHCVHDLRHTYAVYTYWAEKANGNSEPWKLIQSQLGHEHLSTTVRTYLQFVSLFGNFEGASIRALAGLEKGYGEEVDDDESA